MTTEAISLLWYLALGTMLAGVVIAATIRASEERMLRRCSPDHAPRQFCDCARRAISLFLRTELQATNIETGVCPVCGDDWTIAYKGDEEEQ